MAKKKIPKTLDDLESASIDKLVEFFDGPAALRESKHAVRTAQLAVSSLSAVGRLKATHRAKDATQLMVLRHLSTDKGQFAKYVKVSMPHLNPSMQIEG